MELHGLRHVVGAQWGGQKLTEQSGADVKQNQQMSHGKTATGPLVAWLTEVLLQLGGIGHRATRTVHDVDPMTEPAALVVSVCIAGIGQELVGQTAKQPLEDSQRKPLACFAEGRTGERFATPAGHVVQRCVLVEDLEHEQMDRIGRIEQTILPGVFLLVAGGVDRLPVEESRDIWSDALQDANKPVICLHGRALQKGQRGLLHPPVRRRALIRSS